MHDFKKKITSHAFAVTPTGGSL
jgi:hypothetical protein